MAVKFGKFTQKIQEKLQESKLAAKVADVGKAKAESIFNKITQKVQESEAAQEASSPKVEEEEYTEEEKKTTALDVLKNINDFFSDNSITGILKSVLDTERGDISDIDGNNYITRDTARETKDSNDSFEDYCKSIGLDLGNSTNDKVTAAYTKYTQRIAEKNEFNELYDLMNSDSSLSSKLDDKVKIGGSLVNKLFEGSLSDFHDDIAETGAFKTDGESGGILYNKKFDTKISAGLEQMKKLLDDPNVSDEIRTKADEIIQKYENQEKVAIGRRDGGSININSEIDERVTQAGTGDCYLLATLNSLQETENGKQIIKDSIIDNKDGSYTVKLNGVNMSYTFSTEDIEDAEKKLIDGTLGGGAVVGSGSDRYSNGDDDAMLIEMAVEKFRDGIYDGSIAVNEEWPDYASSTVSKEKHDKGLSSLNSGCMNQVLYLLSGVETTTASKEDVPSRTIFVITTDGQENSSRRYSSDDVKKLIGAQKRNGWEFIFLGANIDSVETAKRYGISEDTAVNFFSSTVAGFKDGIVELRGGTFFSLTQLNQGMMISGNEEKVLRINATNSTPKSQNIVAYTNKFMQNYKTEYLGRIRLAFADSNGEEYGATDAQVTKLVGKIVLRTTSSTMSFNAKTGDSAISRAISLSTALENMGYKLNIAQQRITFAR